MKKLSITTLIIISTGTFHEQVFADSICSQIISHYIFKLNNTARLKSESDIKLNHSYLKSLEVKFPKCFQTKVGKQLQQKRPFLLDRKKRKQLIVKPKQTKKKIKGRTVETILIKALMGRKAKLENEDGSEFRGIVRAVSKKFVAIEKDSGRMISVARDSLVSISAINPVKGDKDDDSDTGNSTSYLKRLYNQRLIAKKEDYASARRMRNGGAAITVIGLLLEVVGTVFLVVGAVNYRSRDKSILTAGSVITPIAGALWVPGSVLWAIGNRRMANLSTLSIAPSYRNVGKKVKLLVE